MGGMTSVCNRRYNRSDHLLFQTLFLYLYIWIVLYIYGICLKYFLTNLLQHLKHSIVKGPTDNRIEEFKTLGPFESGNNFLGY